jgi:hypothetical protein
MEHRSGRVERQSIHGPQHRRHVRHARPHLLFLASKHRRQTASPSLCGAKAATGFPSSPSVSQPANHSHAIEQRSTPVLARAAHWAGLLTHAHNPNPEKPACRPQLSCAELTVNQRANVMQGDGIFHCPTPHHTWRARIWHWPTQSLAGPILAVSRQPVSGTSSGRCLELGGRTIMSRFPARLAVGGGCQAGPNRASFPATEDAVRLRRGGSKRRSFER